MVKLPPQSEWPPWMLAAVKDVGVRELPGVATHKRIIEFYQHTPLTDAEARDDSTTSWCASAMSTWLEEGGYRSPRYAMARSFLGYGDKLEKPVFGCIVVFWTGDPAGRHGHVGLYCGDAPHSRLTVLGGNQGNSVCFNSTTYSTARALGYRWPSPSDRLDTPTV